MPNYNTLHTTLLSRTMDKCSTWFCARSNNNNYTAAPTSNVVDAITSNSNGPVIHNANSNVANVTPQSQGVTFFDAISSSDNGTAVTTVLAAPTTTATTYAAAAAASSGMSGTTSSSSAMSSTAALAAATSTNTSGAKPKQQINYDEISQGPGPSPSASSVTCDDTEPPAKNCYRLVMLGSSRTGKTSLVQRFLGQRFDESYTPTIEDFHRKLYRIRSEVYQLDILDTSGNHPFPAMRRLSFLTGDIFVLVFSMDSRESFEEVVRLREQILETKWSALSASSGRSKKNLPRVPMVIAGNKCDRDMKTVQVDEVMGYIAGQDSACVFVECSAKKNFRVEELFYELFMAANLPQEMAPNHHRWVSTAFGAPSPLPAHCPSSRSKKCTLSIKRRLSDACGVVAPNVRRPSIRTDLMLMRTKTCSLGDAEATGTGRGSTSGSSCVIM